MNKWQQIFSEEQRKLPKGASPADRGRAAKRASMRYRGKQVMRDIRGNPSQDKLMTYAIIGGAVFLLFQIMKNQSLPMVTASDNCPNCQPKTGIGL